MEINRNSRGQFSGQDLHKNAQLITAPHHSCSDFRFTAKAILVCVSLLFSTVTIADLLERDLDGDLTTIEGYFESSAGITWYRDFNTAGIPMQWASAVNYADGFELGRHSDWRLPKTFSSFNGICNYQNGGTSACGYLPPTNSSELTHLYYETLGNTGYPQVGWGLKNTEPFLHLPTGTAVYWSGTSVNANNAWVVGMNGGDQGPNSKTIYQHYVALVHDGDIGSRLSGDIADYFEIKLIGNTGVASIDVRNAASTLPTAILGFADTGNGLLTVSDNTTLTILPVDTENNVSFLTIGAMGTGTLDVRGGSTLDGMRYIGVALGEGSRGSFEVSDAGSVINIAGYVAPSETGLPGFATPPAHTQGFLGIGIGGVGIGTIENGAQLNIFQQLDKPTSMSGISVGGELGYSGGGTGTLNVDGAGSSVNVTGDKIMLFVGNVGPQGGTSGGDMLASTGIVNVTDGGKINYNGTGVVNPNFIGNAFIGFGGHGTVNVAGTGSALAINGAGSALTVGIAHSEQSSTAIGALNVTDGGAVLLENTGLLFGSFVSVAPVTGAIGTVVVDGQNSMLDAGSFLLISSNYTLNDFGGDPNDLIPDITPGIGTVTVKNGARIETDFGIGVGNGGTLNGNGTITGGVFVASGGTIAPGLSPGALNIDGDLVLQTGSKLLVEIAGSTPGQFDLINVTGTLVAGGTLEIQLINGFVPKEGDNFAFLLATNFVGTFDQIIAPTFDNGKTLHLDFGPNGVSAAVAVPTPAAIYLLLAGLGFLGLKRRRCTQP